MKSLFFILTLLILSASSFGLGRLSVEDFTETIMITNEYNSQIPEFLSLAKDLASEREYSNDYNCVNFSTKLAEAYEEKGYEARVVSGWYASNPYCKVDDTLMDAIPVASALNSSCIQGHAWVEVVIPVEAVTGRIINAGEQKR